MFNLFKKRDGFLFPGETGEEGTATYEYAFTIMVYGMLIVVIVTFAWYWYNQNMAAIAIHDAAHEAAVQGGDLTAGHARMREIMITLGSQAEDYRGAYQLYTVDDRRSVGGSINVSPGWYLPFLGVYAFNVRATSFQRNWEFYGGPPLSGAMGPWE